MIDAIEKLTRILVQFLALRPYLSLMVFGLAILAFKLYRTGNTRTAYHIKDFYKYPDDFLLTSMATIAFLIGAIGFLFLR